MQHFLKPPARAAGTEIIAAKLLEQFLLATANRAVATFDPGFAEGTPGGAWTCAQKELSDVKSMLRAILPPC